MARGTNYRSEISCPLQSHSFNQTKKGVGATPTQHFQPNMRRVGAVPKTWVGSAPLPSLSNQTHGNFPMPMRARRARPDSGSDDSLYSSTPPQWDLWQGWPVGAPETGLPARAIAAGLRSGGERLASRSDRAAAGRSIGRRTYGRAAQRRRAGGPRFTLPVVTARLPRLPALSAWTGFDTGRLPTDGFQTFRI
jgi:hypothetical protein